MFKEESANFECMYDISCIILLRVVYYILSQCFGVWISAKSCMYSNLLWFAIFCGYKLHIRTHQMNDSDSNPDYSI